jgi:hypothetical protein
MAESVVIVQNLGDPRIENEIKRRLDAALKNYHGRRITIMGSQENDDWEVKGENSHYQRSWTALPIRFEDQTVENVIQVAMEQVIV